MEKTHIHQFWIKKIMSYLKGYFYDKTFFKIQEATYINKNVQKCHHKHVYPIPINLGFIIFCIPVVRILLTLSQSNFNLDLKYI